MKNRNISFTAGLLLLGILGASDSAAAAIEKPISGDNSAPIANINKINDIQEISISDIKEIGSNEICIEINAIRPINSRPISIQIDAGIALISA
jgi:hypothetical protein